MAVNVRFAARFRTRCFFPRSEPGLSGCALMSKQVRDRQKAAKVQQKAQAAKVAGGGIVGAHGDQAVIVDEPSLFHAALDSHSHRSGKSERGKPKLARESDAPFVQKPRCAAAGCRATVDGACPFCSECQILVPSNLRRALTAVGSSREDQLLRLQAARAIAIRQSRPTVYFDGAIRRIEHGGRA